ncbi:RNA-guided endonuclease InsQ/TnpB family protein [Ewingella americana]|uniref:Transposase n=1 Tax=Ewingella americana TaxID=41202 RepID=A0A502GFL0_9GAMM|nr:RNA-guided endonuclease TnpB family protein [Ewingella americana]TPG60080.1 transposase [Ewingella americana]
MIRAFEYRLFPTDIQRETLLQNAGNARFIYNHFLAELRDTGEFLNSYALSKKLTQLKKENGFEFLKLSESSSLQHVAGNLGNAITRFFNKVSKFPVFKKKQVRDSFTISNLNNNCKIWNPASEGCKGKHQIKLAKLGWFRYKSHRPIPENSNIKRITLRLKSDGHWYCSIVTDTGIIPEVVNPKSSVGVDLGLKDFLTLSSGEKISSPKHYHLAQSRLKYLQRSMSRKAKGSNNWNKARRKVAKLHFKIAAQRKDFLNKLSFAIATKYDLVTLETLNVAGLSRNRRLSKSIMTSGWSTFKNMLEYKLADQGKWWCYASPFFASSKIHASSGYKNTELTLAIRYWQCPETGIQVDRDINAAINLDQLGQHWYLTDHLLDSNAYQNAIKSKTLLSLNLPKPESERAA